MFPSAEIPFVPVAVDVPVTITFPEFIVIVPVAFNPDG
jgi:hypothetical protein